MRASSRLWEVEGLTLSGAKVEVLTINPNVDRGDLVHTWSRVEPEEVVEVPVEHKSAATMMADVLAQTLRHLATAALLNAALHAVPRVDHLDVREVEMLALSGAKVMIAPLNAYVDRGDLVHTWSRVEPEEVVEVPVKHESPVLSDVLAQAFRHLATAAVLDAALHTVPSVDDLHQLISIWNK